MPYSGILCMIKIINIIYYINYLFIKENLIYIGENYAL